MFDHMSGGSFMSAVRILAVAAAVVALSQPVLAAEEPSYDWSGIHLGGYVGGGVGIAGGEQSTSGLYPASGYWNPTNDAVVRSAGTQDLYTGAAEAAITLGHNYQQGNLVLGIDLGFGLFKTKTSKTRREGYTNPANAGRGFELDTRAETDWMFTLTPKLGYAVGRFLFQGGAGLAFTRISVSQAFRDDYATQTSSSSSDVKAGFALSGAVNYALTDNWSVKGEYAYMNFGKVDTSARIGANPELVQSFDLQAHTLRLGANYRF